MGRCHDRFFVSRVLGDPAVLLLPVGAGQQDLDALRSSLGLDRPILEQYVISVLAMIRGDFGISFQHQRPAMDVVLERMPVTATLAGTALLFGTLIGAVAGAIAALKRGTISEFIVMVAALLGQATPVFWLGIMLILVFSVDLGWFPTGGSGSVAHLVLPGLTLSVFVSASIARLLRSSLLDIMREDYVRTARAKGLLPRTVFFWHIARNALIPVITMIGIIAGELLGDRWSSKPCSRGPASGASSCRRSRLRISRSSRRGRPGRRHFHRRQPVGRSALWRARSAHPSAIGAAMKAFFLALLKSRAGLFGFLLVSVFVLAAILAPYLGLPVPTRSNLLARMVAPTWTGLFSPGAHPLGTDELGRDILSRIVHGSRITLAIAAAAVILGGIVGTLLGIVAGYYRGMVDRVLMRIVDIQLALPLMLLALLVVAALGPSTRNLVIVLALTSWLRYARIIRGQVLALREREFILSAHAIGAGTWRIMLKHLLPNVMTPALVIATLELARIIIMDAALSFLGLGVQPPNPSLGPHAGRRPCLYLDRLVDRHLPRHCHSPDCAQCQPSG